MTITIEKTLKPKILNGCFFHFSKALWKKARNYGLTKKLFRKEGMILIFCFKMYPFVHNYNRKDYLEKIKDYIKSKDKRFMK